MATSPQHPFTVELQDGTVIGGAQTETDAVTLAAGAVSVVKGTMMVRDSGSGTVTAQIGREKAPPVPAPGVGPQLTGINPTSADPGLPPQLITCTGLGFVDGAEILWDGTAQVTTFHDETSVSARFDISGASGEQVPVQVQNPDGNVSDTIYFVWE